MLVVAVVGALQNQRQGFDTLRMGISARSSGYDPNRVVLHSVDKDLKHEHRIILEIVYRQANSPSKWYDALTDMLSLDKETIRVWLSEVRRRYLLWLGLYIDRTLSEA